MKVDYIGMSSSFLEINSADLLEKAKADLRWLSAKIWETDQWEINRPIHKTVGNSVPEVIAWLKEGDGRAWCVKCQAWVSQVEEHVEQKWGYSDLSKCSQCGYIFDSTIGGWWVDKQAQKAELEERARVDKENDLGHHHFAP